jgi:hypothetical protein
VNCPVTSITVGNSKKVAFLNVNAPQSWATSEAEAFKEIVNGIMNVVKP